MYYNLFFLLLINKSLHEQIKIKNILLFNDISSKKHVQSGHYFKSSFIYTNTDNNGTYITENKNLKHCDVYVSY